MCEAVEKVCLHYGDPDSLPDLQCTLWKFRAKLQHNIFVNSMQRTLDSYFTQK